MRYDLAEKVRGLLNEMTPIDETIGVLEALSQRIARTLGFEIRSFTALLSPKSSWSQEDKEAILPFAQIATEVLHRLGGDYADLAQLVERDAEAYSDWIQPLDADRSFPDLEVLEFTTAQLVESLPAAIVFENDVFEADTLEAEREGLQLFEFELSTLEQQTEQRQTGFLQNLFRRGEPRAE